MRSRALVGTLFLVLIRFLCSSAVWAQSAGGEDPDLSVTVLLDLSYSMRLPLSLNKDDPRSGTRLQEAKILIRKVIEGHDRRTEWALLTFGGSWATSGSRGSGGSGGGAGQSVDNVREKFTTDGSKVVAEIDRLSTWGTTPLADAILDGERFSSANAAGKRRVLLVVSDGIDTEPTLFGIPQAAAKRPRIVFAGIASKDSPELSVALRDWLRKVGGTYVDAADPNAVVSALAQPAVTQPSATEPTTSSFPAPSSSADGSKRTGSDRRRVIPGPELLLVLLIVPIPFAAFLVRRRRRKKLLSEMGRLRRRRVALRFRRESALAIEETEIGELPAKLVFGDRHRSAARAPVVDLRDNRPILTSSKPVLVNGVAVKSAVLRVGDRVRTVRDAWTYQGVSVRTSGPPDPPRLSLVPFVATTLMLLLGSLALLLVFGSSVIREMQPKRPLQPAASMSAPERQLAHSLSGNRSPNLSDSGSSSAEKPGIGSLIGSAEAPMPFVHTEMVAPESQPDYFNADIMFIHTHPDDESIDFGGLIAMEARSGKRVVTVIFTDGTAGLDQYPNRRTGGIYPAHDLRGAALAGVRVREAEAALSILGSREYVRLGLRNNPYDSIREILPLHEVLRRWGGESRVVGELVRLIEGFRPRIIVSPDEHHRGVFKHFEHEAVGYVTDQAIRYLHAHGEDFVGAHLIGIDPMLTGQYQNVFGVNVMAVDPQSGLTYRAIQVGALKEHVTQRDASVIGVEVVPNFADEYYVARFWNLPTPISEYFAPPR